MNNKDLKISIKEWSTVCRVIKKIKQGIINMEDSRIEEIFNIQQRFEEISMFGPADDIILKRKFKNAKNDFEIINRFAQLYNEVSYINDIFEEKAPENMSLFDYYISEE